MRGRKDITLRFFNHQILLMAGYTDKDMRDMLGVLNELPLERMEELLRRKLSQALESVSVCPNCGTSLNREVSRIP
jgi:uncharacterized protein with PIN domain